MKNKALAIMFFGVSLLAGNALSATDVKENKEEVNKIVEQVKGEKTEKAMEESKNTNIQESNQQEKQEEKTSENLLEKTKKAFSNLENQKIVEQLDRMKLPKEAYQIKPTKIDGLKEVRVGANRMYIDEKASTIIIGDMYQVGNDGNLINVKQQELFAKLKDFESSMISYKAKDEKYVVTAFVDSTCHYCIKLHNEMKEYNDKGISFQFLAYPREGLESETARLMEGAFTAENKQEALSLLEHRKFNVEKPVNIVKQHYELGEEFGLTGTPTLILPNGEVIPGYLKPEQLLKTLEEIK